MVKNLLPVLIMAAVCSPLPIVAAAQKHHVEQQRDLRLEHADVPMYPQIARTVGISGTVEVQVTVMDGKVTNTEVKSGPPILARAAVENIQSWRFYRSSTRHSR
jgi:TonB family protein